MPGVIASGGDPHLGGDDWDAVIVDWIKTNYLDPAGNIFAGRLHLCLHSWLSSWTVCGA